MSQQDDRDQRPAQPGEPAAPAPAYGTPPVYGTPPPYGTPPAAAYPAYDEPPGYGEAGYGQMPSRLDAPAYREPSQAVLALVLGVVGLCGFLVMSPFAWVIGNRELRAIDAGRRDPANRGVAVAGKITGIVGSVVLLFFAIGFVILALAALSLFVA